MGTTHVLLIYNFYKYTFLKTKEASIFKNVFKIILNIDLEHVRSGWECLLFGSIIAELEYYSGNLLEKLLHSALLNNEILPWNFMKKGFTVGVLFGKNWVCLQQLLFWTPPYGYLWNKFLWGKINSAALSYKVYLLQGRTA